MVKRTHLLIAVLASVVAGALVSASVSQLAQVAYSGVNPQSARGVSHTDTSGYRNQRSIMNETVHGSSPEIQSTRPAEEQNENERNEPESVMPVPEHCAGTSHQRRTQCLMQYLDGILFRLHQND
jgi:hypothetical protein